MVKKKQTNVQLITEMMEFSQYGALSQLFIMDAIGKLADSVAALTDEEIRIEMEGSFISAGAWHGVAKEIQRKISQHYGESIAKREDLK